MDSGFRARNDSARFRFAALLARLTARDLDQPLGDGWTVKVALLHLAFWDRFAAAALTERQRIGFTSSGDDADRINAAALADWLLVPPQAALTEVLRAAETTDRAAAGISEALRIEIGAGGERWAFDRGIHRLEHIEQIERLLSIQSSSDEVHR